MLLSVIIPAYNEEKTIREIIERVRRVPPRKEIVVVNDGSRDKTAAILDELKGYLAPDEFFSRLVVIHKKNGGKGSALRAGIAAASGDIILFQDADLEYDPKDYPGLIEPIVAGRTKAVMGSRLLAGGNIWVGGKPSFAYVRNHLGIRLITLLTNLLFGKHATDYEGCYKAFDAVLLKSIPLEADGFELDNELVCKLFRLGRTVMEVSTQYYPRSYEEGKKIKVRDGLKILWTIIRWRFAPIYLTSDKVRNK